jgi:hypothetical protein
MGDETKARDSRLRAFSALIGQIDNGRLHADISSEIEDLVAEMQNVAGGHVATKGKISLSLDLKYDPKTGMFEIGGDYKVSSPKEPRGRSVFWATSQNVLTLDNPRQQQMFPRDVNTARGEAKSV